MMENKRKIKSFIRREGRVTKRQQHAMDTLWDRFVIESKACEFKQITADYKYINFEIGFGMGKSLAEMAQGQPEELFIGVEVHKPGVAALLAEILERNLNNVVVLCEDADELINTWIPDEALNRVLILFPDPWPKKKHHKRRLVQAPFVERLAKKIKNGGILHMATDWEPYAEEMLAVVKSCASLKYLAMMGPIYSQRPNTKFEQRGQRLGHVINDIISAKK